jgi:hypothetical protein
VADLYYMAERFGIAVRLMATTEGSLRERIRDAYISSARLAQTVEGDHLNAVPSDELIQRMQKLSERVTADGTSDTGFVVMSDADVEATAEDIYEIFLAIEDELRGKDS